MCEIIEKSSEKNGGFAINFNQDFTSLAVLSTTGYRLFSLATVNIVDEIFCSNNEEIKITERLFSSSLVVVVTAAEVNKLKVCHFKKGSEICNYSYPSPILSVKLNRSRLVVCLKDSLYIHNIRDMKLLHSILNIPDNESGLCTLSLNSHLAYPISSTAGELQIFDAGNLISRIKVKAHESTLSAIDFSPNGNLLATASEKGTVIRVFCVKNGQKVHEFRRGVKRQVKIASLKFSYCANYLCVSSNTETVHVFKIDPKALENTERQNVINSSRDDDVHSDDSASSAESAKLAADKTPESKWMFGLLSKAVSSYFPTHVSDVFTQDRAFATVQLAQPGMKHECVIAKLEKESKLLVACEDGFLYIYDFDTTDGGVCKLNRAHDLRSTLHDITEIDLSGNDCDKTRSPSKNNKSGSYAGVLRGKKRDKLTVNITSTDSDKYRELHDAVEFPQRSIFDDVQFPPITNAALAVRAAE